MYPNSSWFSSNRRGPSFRSLLVAQQPRIIEEGNRFWCRNKADTLSELLNRNLAERNSAFSPQLRSSIYAKKCGLETRAGAGFYRAMRNRPGPRSKSGNSQKRSLVPESSGIGVMFHGAESQALKDERKTIALRYLKILGLDSVGRYTCRPLPVCDLSAGFLAPRFVPDAREAGE